MCDGIGINRRVGIFKSGIVRSCEVEDFLVFGRAECDLFLVFGGWYCRC